MKHPPVPCVPPSEEVEIEEMRAKARLVADDVRQLLRMGYRSASLMIDDLVFYGCRCPNCAGVVRILHDGDVYEPDWLNR